MSARLIEPSASRLCTRRQDRVLQTPELAVMVTVVVPLTVPLLAVTVSLPAAREP